MGNQEGSQQQAHLIKKKKINLTILTPIRQKLMDCAIFKMDQFSIVFLKRDFRQRISNKLKSLRVLLYLSSKWLKRGRMLEIRLLSLKRYFKCCIVQASFKKKMHVYMEQSALMVALKNCLSILHYRNFWKTKSFVTPGWEDYMPRRDSSSVILLPNIKILQSKSLKFRDWFKKLSKQI